MRAILLAVALSTSFAALAETRVAYVAGGCFWCVEADFEKLPGVLGAVSGYMGGKEQNPTYEQVSAHATGHAEAVEISYDPDKLSYAQLIDHFWHHIDPLTRDAQFCDEGSQYRSAIFYRDEAEKAEALASRARLEKQLGKAFVTEISAASRFWPAEGYHQDYYRKNPVRYNYYRLACGRDARVREIWGKAH